MLLFKQSYRCGRSCQGRSPALTQLHFVHVEFNSKGPIPHSIARFGAGVIPLTSTEMQQLRAHETK